ncbi:NAD(P)-binding domain-containing protein [Flagellimonas iocasae]|uniref:NAD(P)-binding domain-containing protein n=1 Tax=Flagellimonas iocasae TaxID=2055905 RepID=A0ABW4XTD8_9FLAO
MRLGFLGIGRIATSVIKGLCTSSIEDVTIHISPRNEENSKSLAAAFPNVHRLESNQEVLDNSDYIFIALPASNAVEVLKGLKFRNDHNVVSFIAFLKYDALAHAVEPAKKVGRAIPLPTVEKHNCPIPVFKSDKTVVQILEHIGKPIVIEDETELHAIWTLTGLIAPFFDLCGTLSDWAKTKGVNPEVANPYILDMYCSLASPSPQGGTPNFDGLKEEATTPKGMNEQALKMIQSEEAHEVYRNALEAIMSRFDD